MACRGLRGRALTDALSSLSLSSLLAAWELVVSRKVKVGFLEEGHLNWALNHTEEFSRLRRKGMVIWGREQPVSAKTRGT